MTRPTFTAPLVALLSACSDGALTSPSEDLEVTPQYSASTRKTVAIELHNQARLRRLDNGQQYVEIQLRAKCPTGYQQLEEPLTLTQGEFTFGQGGFGMICNGQWQQRTFRVFSTGDVEFRRGPARANVTLQVEHPTTGELLSASDTEFLKLR
jgi:hypothetical protein